MRLATLRRDGGTFAVRVDSENSATIIKGYADLSELLQDAQWEALARDASGEVVQLADADYAPVVPRPGKILCVGLNYATHIKEMGRELPEYPTLFSKFKEALAGPFDDLVVPKYAARQLDWEAELAIVIGKHAYQVNEDEASAHIAGYSVMNDYTMRDYQYRSAQWDQGKTFEKTSGFGPHLVTDYKVGTRIEARLDGVVMQSANTGDLVFKPEALIGYISHIVSLQPGDVIITGTAGGVGHARKPPRYIQSGETVEIEIEGLGMIRNKTVVK